MKYSQRTSSLWNNNFSKLHVPNTLAPLSQTLVLSIPAWWAQSWAKQLCCQGFIWRPLSCGFITPGNQYLWVVRLLYSSQVWLSPWWPQIILWEFHDVQPKLLNTRPFTILLACSKPQLLLLPRLPGNRRVKYQVWERSAWWPNCAYA